LVRRHLRTAREDGLTSAEIQNARHKPVDTHLRVALKRSDDTNGLLFEKESRDLDRIATDIHQGAPAPLLNVSNVLRIAIEIAECRDDGAQIAQCSRPDELPNSQPLRMRPDHECLADPNARSIANRHQLPAFVGAEANRLFAKNMFARFRRPNGPRYV
jgi:hypothetical protein